MLTKNYLKSLFLLLCMISGVGTAWAADTWVKTAPSSLQTGDVVVIVDQTSGKAMSNNNGTSSAPSATAVTLNGDKTEITSEVASTLQWEVTVNDGSYQFGVANSSNYLYCTQTNNGVRVGTNANNAFTVYDNDGVDFLVNTATTRYVGVYNGQDWRCYTSINANIKTCVTAFYKKAPADPVDLTSFAFSNATPSVTLSKNNEGSYEASYTQTVTVNPDDYDGTIIYAIDEQNSTIGENTIVDVDENGVVSILADANEASTIVVKASGTGTTAYNKPADATYTLTVNVAPVGVGTPTFSLATGAYYYGTTVEIEAVNSALITYTTDGTTPTMESTTYSDPVAITKTMTLKAKAWDDGLNESEIASIDYTLKAPEAPTFSVEGGEVVQGSTITLTPGEGGSVVVYTTDGSTPTIDSDIYIDPIKINAAMTIKAATVDDGDNLSAIASYEFTVKKAVIYEKVTDAESLADGDQVLVVCESKEMAMGAQAATYRTNVNVEITEYSIINPSSDIEVVTLESVEGGWLLKAEDGYLVSSSVKSLKTTANAEDASIVSIDIDNGDAILAFGSNGYLKYNSSSPRFTTYASGQTSIQLYRLQENLEEATITITPSENFTLNNGETKVLTVTASNGEVITATSSDEEVATVKKTGTNEYTVTAVSGTAEGTDVTITFSTEKTATHKAGKATITATVKDARVELDLSFAETSVEVNVGEDVAAPTLNGNVGGGAVTFASENESIATVNATTGVVTGVAEGVTTITATVAEVTGYKGGTATFEVIVIDPNKKGTKNNPYTVAEAIDAIDNSGDVTGVYATGVVSEIVTAYSSQYGNISYNISVDGTTEKAQLQAFRGKSYNGENFTSKDDIQVGDVVVIYGNLTKYKTTYEFEQDNQLVSLTRKAEAELSFEKEAYEVRLGNDFDEPELLNPNNLSSITWESSNEAVATVDSEGAVTVKAVGTTTITATFAGNEDYKAGEASYELTVTNDKLDAGLELLVDAGISMNAATEKDITTLFTVTSDGAVTYESNDEEVAIVSEGKLVAVAPGETTITINVAEADDYKPATVALPVTVTVYADVAAFDPNAKSGYVLVTDASTLQAGDNLILVSSNEDGKAYAMEAQNANNRGQVEVSIKGGIITDINKAQEIILEGVAGAWYLNVGEDSYLYAASNSLNYLRSADFETVGDNGKAVININGSASIVFQGDNSRNNLRYNAANSLFSCYASTSNMDEPYIYRYQSAGVTIGSTGWRTLVASANVKFPAGVTAYIVTAEDGNKAKLKAVKAVKANVPVLLKGDAGTYTLTVAENEECANTEANLLKVSEQNTCENVYVLANKSNGVGFYQWTGGWMGAGRVYLPVPVSGARGFLAFDEDGETTGISTIQNAKQGTKEIYNLNGQRVNQPAKGLYIVNGKKVFIK